MPFIGKLLFYGMLMLTALLLPLQLVGQATNKSNVTDAFGPIAGVNFALFYPKDQNNIPVNAGNPQLLPGGIVGLSYHHAFSPRWAHIFQLRLSDNQLKYWKATEQRWYMNHEWVTVKSDSGDYHTKYQAVSMNYLIGWCVNKKIRWNIYGGLQLNYTIANQSAKTVDGVVYGTIVSHDFVPYAEPVYYYDETSIIYSQQEYGEVLFRTDVKVNLSEQWSIRPTLEYAINTGYVHNLTRDRIAFSLEVYKSL